MFTSILLCLDVDDQASTQAVLAAANHYQGQDVRCAAIAVVPDMMSAVSQASHFEAFTRDKREDWVSHCLERTQGQLQSSLNDHAEGASPPEAIVRSGAIYDEIIQAAQDVEADLIIIGAHRPELRDYLLGPNAARVVRHSMTSVLVIR